MVQEAYIQGISTRSVAVIVAVGANADGRREVLGMQVGPSEAETFWTDLPRAGSLGGA